MIPTIIQTTVQGARVIKAVDVPFKETILYDLLIALLTGLISSVLFFAILRIFAPRIKTCNII
jgi:hypothetical protein